METVSTNGVSAFESRALRLKQLCAATWSASPELSVGSDLVDREWVALTCSRLGHDHQLHREVCRFLSRSMLDIRQRHAACVVASQSAIEPWATRAAQLYDVPLIRLTKAESATERENSIQICFSVGESNDLNRALIAIADRVDAMYVRQAGKIADAIRCRLSFQSDASARIGVVTSRTSAAKDLIKQGAIGWYVDFQQANRQPNLSSDSTDPQVNPDWMRTDGQWFVHCTRACVGPWPGQLQHQYQDALLLQQLEESRTSCDTLERIMRTERLLASAIASAKKYPVVCFSEASLHQLLTERCFRQHLHRWDYEPYGVAIRRKVAKDIGIAPVIYGERSDRNQICASQQHLFQAKGKTYDWTRQREWRADSDVVLSSLPKNDVRYFAGSISEASRLSAQFNIAVDVAQVVEP